jgi:hypothetical protein
VVRTLFKKNPWYPYKEIKPNPDGTYFLVGLTEAEEERKGK